MITAVVGDVAALTRISAVAASTHSKAASDAVPTGAARSMTVLGAAKRVLRPLQRRAHDLRARHRRFQLHRSLRALEDSAAALTPDSALLSRLVYGWGNEVWSAREEYLAAVLRECVAARGPVLECGSGLTTLVLAAIARAHGVAVWSLEHLTEWGERVRRELSRMRSTDLELDIRPMRSWPDFDWYDPPLQRMPPRFAVVVCDGPPHTTRGGRYGLGPVMRDRLGPGTVILLDDAGRAAEQAIAARWARELDADLGVVGVEKPFFRLVLRAPAARS